MQGVTGAGGYKAQREDGTRGIQNAEVTEDRRSQRTEGDKAAAGDTAYSEGGTRWTHGTAVPPLSPTSRHQNHTFPSVCLEWRTCKLRIQLRSAYIHRHSCMARFGPSPASGKHR